MKLITTCSTAVQSTLTVDECIALMERETAEFEEELKKRQLEIVMRLKLDNTVLISDVALIEIASAMAVIVKLKLHGLESF